MTQLAPFRRAVQALEGTRFPPLRDCRTVARGWSREWNAHRRVPQLPPDAIVPLDATSDVILQCSRSRWDFRPQTYAQESAFAHELAARGRTFAVTDMPDVLFDKSVVWFLADNFMTPRLWDYSLQARQFTRGLEAQANRLFRSSEETAYWENKVYMHRRLADVGAPTPQTRIITAEDWASTVFDLEPVLIKQEHSAGSAGIHYFATSGAARAFVARYLFRPTESLIMQEVVPGGTRDMRVTVVGDRPIPSATYWRIKSPETLARSDWTTTATTYNSRVEHGDIPDSAVALATRYIRELNVRTAGVDLIWVDDDLSRYPLILEFSPYYQPNPPKPARYEHLSYNEFKANWAAEDGYLTRQYFAFRDIAAQILDQGLF